MSETRRETSGHFRSVFDASAIGIALVGRTGAIERCNPALSRMLGATPSDLQGRAIADIAQRDEWTSVEAGFAELLAGLRSAWHGERRFRHANGSEVWARLAVTPVRGPDDLPTGVLVMAEDITRERAVQQERDRALADLTERVKEATALHATSRILQYTEIALPETFQRIVEVLPPAFHFPAITEARIRFGELEARTAGFRDVPRRITSAFETEDGTTGTIAVVLTGAPPDGQPDFLDEEQRLIDSIAESLTVAIDHRHAEEALQRSEERLQLTLSSARIGVWEWDLASGRVAWSKELEQIAGLAPGSFGGTLADYQALVHPDDAPIMRQAVARAVEDPARDDTFESELRMRLPDGRYRWCLSRGRVLRGVDGRPERMLGVMHDISGIRELQQQFEQAQKMEALGRLAGGVAHDFNNLLTVIRGCAEFIAADLAADDPHADDLRELTDATDRAAALTRQLLAFSRTQTLDRRPVDPNEVVAGMEKLVRRIIGAPIESRLELEEGIGMVRIDRGQLEQVLMNLAVNARDAMPDGGRLTIQTRAAQFEEHVRLREFELPAGRYVVLQVSDTGSGMTTEVQQRLFEAFFTTKEVGRGTGLGLATVHGIVKQAGGAIFVYSEVGRGSTFKVYLPWHSDDGHARVDVALDARALSGAERVLLIDDDEGVRALAERTLRTAGYDVRSYGNPLEGLATLAERGVAFDLLVTDVVMPRMQGPEIAAAFRRAHPDGRVLYVTGFSDRQIAQERPTHLLLKPFAPSGLLRAVRELLDRPAAG